MAAVGAADGPANRRRSRPHHDHRSSLSRSARLTIGATSVGSPAGACSACVCCIALRAPSRFPVAAVQRQQRLHCQPSSVGPQASSPAHRLRCACQARAGVLACGRQVQRPAGRPSAVFDAASCQKAQLPHAIYRRPLAASASASCSPKSPRQRFGNAQQVCPQLHHTRRGLLIPQQPHPLRRGWALSPCPRVLALAAAHARAETPSCACRETRPTSSPG